MDRQLLTKLLAQVKTPSYIFDIDEFNKRALLVKEFFGDKTSLCFSIKANPFLLKNIPDVFDKIEVCSPGELTICEKSDVDGSKIIFSGVNKTATDIERAMDYKVGTFTAESYLHAKLINNCAAKRQLKVPVLVRVSDGSQFGMDENDVFNLISHRDNYENIEFVGLHYFTGTQKRKPSIIEKELDYICDFADRLKTQCSFNVERIEYGTGLAVDYFSSDADNLERERLQAISTKIREVAEKFKLTVEMGRFFAAPCGYYFTKVIDTKTNSDINYAILDGGLNQLKYDGQIHGMQTPEIIHIKNSFDLNARAEKWTLCGSLCTTSDILAKSVEFNNLEIGDTLVFCRTGAYSAMEGMALFLSRELPLVSLYSEKTGIEIVRGLIYTDQFNTP